ncbi:MAG: virulence factor family protein, partial [Bacteriovoracaceae bacterium]|nr:virulence factor family protein [Bacteriovoracaceae bacterium]
LVLLSAILFSAVLVAFIPKFSILLTQGSATEVFSGNAGIYFRLLGLATIPNLMNAFLASLLTAEGRPKTPVILNCVSIFTVIILFLFSKKSIEDFCFATLIGIYLEGILLWMATKKMGFPNLFPFVPAPKLLTPFLKQSSFFLGGAALAYSSDFVDRSMAASLGSGSVSAIAYGSKITQLALSILVTGLSAYLLPYFSKLHSEGEFLRLKEEFLSFEKKIFLLSVLITSLIIWVSPLVLRLLFERGSFAHSDTLSVSEFQILFALQIPFYMTGMMSVWIINARQDNHLLAWIGASSFFVNILGNYFLMKFMGIKGIALATSLVYLLSFLLVRFFALRKFSPSK